MVLIIQFIRKLIKHVFKFYTCFTYILDKSRIFPELIWCFAFSPGQPRPRVWWTFNGDILSENTIYESINTTLLKRENITQSDLNIPTLKRIHHEAHFGCYGTNSQLMPPMSSNISLMLNSKLTINILILFSKKKSL